MLLMHGARLVEQLEQGLVVNGVQTRRNSAGNGVTGRHGAAE